MNVFVLGTGRCGTMTFSKACRHLTNYTSGHETRVRKLYKRLDYPPNHIESDARLVWHFGQLFSKYPDAFYVHLVRKQEEVVNSLMKRWNTSRFLRFMRCALINKEEKSYRTKEDRAEICRLYVRMVQSNLETLIGFIPNSMTIHLHEAIIVFPEFLEKIKAEGDLQAAINEWKVKYNASR